MMRSCRNFSKEAGSRTRSSTGMKQSITNFTVCFLEDFFDFGWRKRKRSHFESGKKTESERDRHNERRKERRRGRCETERIQQFHAISGLSTRELQLAAAVAHDEGGDAPIGVLTLSPSRAEPGQGTKHHHTNETAAKRTNHCPTRLLRVCDNHREVNSATVNRVIVPCARMSQQPSHALCQHLHSVGPKQGCAAATSPERDERGAKQHRAAEKITLHDTPQRIELCRRKYDTERHAHSPRAAW